MISGALGTNWLRRARPMLGTLVEVGVRDCGTGGEKMIRAAFEAISGIQACLSRFEAESDITRFHALPAGASLAIRSPTAEVLSAARGLQEASDGLFDITLGSAPGGWHCDGVRLYKLSGDVRLDPGGIGKGYAVDRAVEAMLSNGCESGWVNAGGDLRAFGDAELPLSLRDETLGGVRSFATISNGAFATSHFDRGSRSRATALRPVRAHVSVAAPLCLWADALTKLVAITGNTLLPLLSRHGAQAWLH
ncbi:MAG: FAD:protein FMN transferase [Betaproteobacteria bacterium]|nr:FAD:protein FMN transferase [Betaproteobacteria bacterium]